MSNTFERTLQSQQKKLVVQVTLLQWLGTKNRTWETKCELSRCGAAVRHVSWKKWRKKLVRVFLLISPISLIEALSVATFPRSYLFLQLMGLHYVVFCSFRKLLALCTAPYQHSGHAYLGMTRDIQKLKRGNCKTKLSYLCPEQCRLRTHELCS